MFSETYLGLIDNVALLLALVLLYDTLPLRPKPEGRRLWEAVAGLILGFIGVAVMLTPLRFVPGVIFDTRSILLSVSGLFFGWIPTLIAVGITGLLRVYQGGAGALMGVGVIATSGGLGLAWRHYRKKRIRPYGWLELGLFGLVVHLAMLLWMFSLPWPMVPAVMRKIGIPVMLVYPVGTVLLGKLLDRQRERKKAERTLHSLSVRQEAILAAVPDIIMEVDQNKVYTWANPAGLAFFGVGVIGREAAFYFEGEQETYQSIQPLFDGAEDVIYLESWQRRRDGEKRLLAWWCRVLKDESGKVTGALSTARDVTDQKKTEEEIRRLNVELEQRVDERTAQLEVRNRELETFSYTVSHDLKAPLRGIDGYSRLLLEDYSERLDDEGKTFLNNIRKAALQMNQLIEDLLAYSRLERRPLQAARVNLAQLTEALLGERGTEAQARGVTVTVDLACEVVSADPDGLMLVLRNLLDNAFKFTQSVPGPVIAIGGREEETACLLWVRDNGIGFDKKYQERVFDIFQRLNRAEEYPGTGIGLAIVRKAVERMGGRAWAEGQPGKGAVFFVEIPKTRG